MYNHFQLTKKYIAYYVNATNGSGHGVHSPFVFDFIANVLNDKKIYNHFKEIENCRKKLLKDDSIISIEDFGAGSTTLKSKKRVVKDVAKSSLKSKKYSQLLYKIVKHYAPNTILELGTSFGITTSYLASANKASTLITCEGAKSIAAMANNTFEELKIKNIKLNIGNFDEVLPTVLDQLSSIDFAFIDGNHRLKPTLNYFEQLLKKTTLKSILIFDDIHWSADMEKAWQTIQQHPKVTLTIDLFFIGIVFFDDNIKMPQHFSIRF